MPETIDRYQLREVLGTGAFGTVWLAHDPVVGIDVALKVLADNWSRHHEMRDRFVAEARLGLSVNSTKLLRVHTVNETDEGVPYIVMTFANGGTLADRLNERSKMSSAAGTGPFALTETLHIGEQMAAGLADLHAAGHIHRDLKPANVLFHNGTGGEELLLGDFGLARALDNTAITLISGSPGYVAPEQAGGQTQLTAAADLYPLGVILTEMLTGEPPVSNTSFPNAAQQATIDVAQHFAHHQIPAPPALLELINQMLHHDPAHRPASAGDVAARLASMATRGEPSIAAVENPSPEPATPTAPATVVQEPAPLPDHHAAGHHAAPTSEHEPASSNRTGVLVGAAVGLVAVVVLAIVLLRPDSQTDPAAQPTSTSAAAQQTTTDSAIAPSTSAATTAPPATATPETSTLRADAPLPPGSVIDRINTTSVQIDADVAAEVDGVVDFYRQLADWDIDEDSPLADGGHSLEISRDSERIGITITPAALTSGTDVSNIVLVGLAPA